jgi:uncharacterized delta-60 repeat protein
VSSGKARFPLRLAIILLPAFFVLWLQFPFSGAAAQIPEWRSSWINRRDAIIHPPASVGELQESEVFLSLLFNKYPLTPSTPQLNAISNEDGDGTYTVSWTAVKGAETYLLQEDVNSNFSSPTTAYEGPATSKGISGKGVGTYYYRLMASNSYASSGWSNVESVVVSVTQPACPQTGSWRGNTNQGRSISFTVEDSPQCQIAPGSLKISFITSQCGSITFEFGPGTGFPITNNKFDTSNTSNSVRVSGEFTSANTAKGSFSYDVYYSTYRCRGSGTWESYPVAGADGPVWALLIQPDGKILVGGDFPQVGGQPHENLARLNSNGSLDTTFNPELDSYVKALAIHPDGILVGGDFSQVNGQDHAGIARLKPDGSLDTGFNPQINGEVYALAVQSNGKILVGGHFSGVDGQARNNLARLNSNGSLDTTFTHQVSLPVNALLVQPDDKIWVANNDSRLVRLHPEGGTDVSPPITWNVFALALQPDQKLIAAGFSNIVRINSNGTLDTDFDAPEPNANVKALGVLNDGRITVGGYFSKLDTLSIKYLGQLSSNGTAIQSFAPTPNGYVYALAVQLDNKILVGGEFSILDGQMRNSIARLNPDGSLDESFVVQ